jgi:hypothetical protein
MAVSGLFIALTTFFPRWRQNNPLKCVFLPERAVWHPSGRTGLVMYRDVTLLCGVSGSQHCDGSWCLNLQGQAVLTLKMKAPQSFEMSWTTQPMTQYHKSWDLNPQCHHYDNLKSHKCSLVSPVRQNMICQTDISEQETLYLPAPATVVLLHPSAYKTLYCFSCYVTCTQDVSCC